MTRPLIIDTFPFHDEFDILECRLVELYDAVDWFVLVEADVTHQDRPKPYYYLDNQDRFARWKDKIIPVQATGLPTAVTDPDPWARELTQRAHVQTGLDRIGATATDIVLHGDVDEIPTAIAARNVRPKPGWFVAFEQRLHCFAVDWFHPDVWCGTMAATVETVHALTDTVNGFARLRDRRNGAPYPALHVTNLPDAGWHLSWLGGRERALHKLGAFCHPEVADRILTGLEDDRFYREGWHVDGRRMAAVDVDGSWPKWIREGNAPNSWFRPR